MPHLSIAGLALLAAAAPDAAPSKPPVPVVAQDVKHDLSPPLFLIRPKSDAEVIAATHEPVRLPKARGSRSGNEPRIAIEEGESAGESPMGPMPFPLLSFDGVANRNNIAPPDTNGDVGPNHYVQWVNLSYAVWNKQGTLVFGPVNGNTIWAGFGGLCETRNNGDPIALYDPIADRWLLSQLAFIDFNNYHQCIAVSQTPDPTGAWYRYDFLFSTSLLNDYPKFGVWPDAYYLGVNQQSGPSRTFAGQGVMAFERDKMLQGLPARTVYFDLFGVNSNFSGAIPADLDGPGRPPPGAPNLFVEMDDDGFGWTPIDRMSIWSFHVDWNDPPSSTFGVGGNPDQVIDLTAAGYPFDSDLCGYVSECIPQLGVTMKIDALSDRLMYRLVYRNWGDHESLTVNHSVDVDGTDHAGVRWYELRRTGGSWGVHQAGTHAPDGEHRWMGSAAMDGSGDLAVGYSLSSATTAPTVRYAGRLPSDPPGTLPQTEATLVAGMGSQTGVRRWGDYSMLAVDPVDDCTFWYTQEYYAATSGTGWTTRIGSFRFPSCVACAEVGRPAIVLAKEAPGVRVSWAAARNATTYDAVSGSLLALRGSGGNFASATAACAADDVSGTSVLLGDPDPPAGAGTYYLVRATGTGCRGSYDDDPARLAGPRDPGIAAAPSACP